MEKQKLDKLIEQLKEMDTNHVTFFDAKERLRKQGYSDIEISNALYSFSYDGKPNPPIKEDPITKYYAANPKEAARVAGYIAKNARGNPNGPRAAYYLASRYAPGPHAKAYYSYKFYDSIDYPFFTMIALTAISTAVTIKYGLHKNYAYSGVVVVTVYWLFKLFARRFLPLGKVKKVI